MTKIDNVVMLVDITRIHKEGCAISEHTWNDAPQNIKQKNRMENYMHDRVVSLTESVTH